MKYELLKIGICCLPALGTLGGCSGDNVLSSKEKNGNSIEFGTANTGSRGVVTASVRKIGVFGYSHTGNFDADLAARVPNYFLNQAVVDIPGNGTWSYSGITRYWPSDGTFLSFFAYAPYIDIENSFALYPAATTDTGAPTITYTVPAGVLDQMDLMWSNRLDMTFAASNSGRVEFAMNHALTRVDVMVKLHEKEEGTPFIITFNKLTIRNVVGSGTLDLSKSPGDEGIWSVTRPADDGGWASYTITPGGHGGMADLVFDAGNLSPAPEETNPWEFNSLLKAGQYFLLIPQDIFGRNDGLTPAELVLDYTVTDTLDGEETPCEEIIPLSRPTLSTWEPGMGITYQLTLSLVNGVLITFDIESIVHSQPWIPVNNTSGVPPGSSGGPISGTVN